MEVYYDKKNYGVYESKAKIWQYFNHDYNFVKICPGIAYCV
jgi:hypothetical protein